MGEEFYRYLPAVTMTYMLVQILKERQDKMLSPHTLIQQLSFSLYEHSTEFIECNKRWNREDKKRLREKGQPTTWLDQRRVAFQSPQLGSLYRLVNSSAQSNTILLQPNKWSFSIEREGQVRVEGHTNILSGGLFSSSADSGYTSHSDFLVNDYLHYFLVCSLSLDTKFGPQKTSLHNCL